MQYVAFMRAINVGRRRIKMDLLRQVFEQFGFTDVSTYIASGNVVFDSPTPPQEEALEAHFEREVGFSTRVFIRSANQVRSIVTNQPWRHDNALVEVSFLSFEPDATSSRALEAAVAPPESLAVIGTEVFFLREGKGLPTTHKEADTVRMLGGETTRRGMATVTRIAGRLRP